LKASFCNWWRVLKCIDPSPRPHPHWQIVHCHQGYAEYARSAINPAKPPNPAGGGQYLPAYTLTFQFEMPLTNTIAMTKLPDFRQAIIECAWLIRFTIASAIPTYAEWQYRSGQTVVFKWLAKSTP